MDVGLREQTVRQVAANHFLAVGIEGVIDDPLRRIDLVIVLETEVPESLGDCVQPGSLVSFQSDPITTSAISAVTGSTSDRRARTITAPVMAPIAAAVTPSTNATSAGRWPYFLK